MKTLLAILLLIPTLAQGATLSPHAATAPAKETGIPLHSNDPIDIKSDRLEAHNKERKIIFLGNVRARQRDALIFADRLTAYYDKSGKDIERIVAEGNVKITQEDKVGTSQEAVFENQSRKILLTGDPHLWQGKDELRGETITVFLDEDRVLIDKARGVFTPGHLTHPNLSEPAK